MKIRFLGTGTSQGIPVIGCHCEVCTSVNPKDRRLRSSVLLTKNQKNYIIDVGPDFRQQMLEGKIEELAGVFLTHEHNDHVIGLDDVRPFIFRQKKEMPIYGLPRVLDEIKDRFSYAFKANAYPGAPRFELNPIHESEKLRMEEFEIEAIPVFHGTLPILGFRIDDFAYLTDVKSIPQLSKQKLQDLDVLVLSALRREQPHHSHLTLEEAIELVNELKPKRTYLMHMGHRMGLHDEVNSILPDYIDLAYDGLVINTC